MAPILFFSKTARGQLALAPLGVRQPAPRALPESDQVVDLGAIQRGLDVEQGAQRDLDVTVEASPSPRIAGTPQIISSDKKVKPPRPKRPSLYEVARRF